MSFSTVFPGVDRRAWPAGRAARSQTGEDDSDEPDSSHSVGTIGAELATVNHVADSAGVYALCGSDDIPHHDTSSTDTIGVMKKTLKLPTQRSLMMVLTDRALAQVAAGKEDAGILIDKIVGGGGSDQPVETATIIHGS
jgi:hypothetical protein